MGGRRSHCCFYLYIISGKDSCLQLYDALLYVCKCYLKKILNISCLITFINRSFVLRVIGIAKTQFVCVESVLCEQTTALAAGRLANKKLQ